MKASSKELESPQGTYRRVLTLTDRLDDARENLAEQPGHNAALRVQSIKKLRQQEQNKIKPYLASNRDKTE